MHWLIRQYEMAISIKIVQNSSTDNTEPYNRLMGRNYLLRGAATMLLMTKIPNKRGRKPKSEGGKASISRTYRFDPAILAAVDQFIAAQKFKTTRTDVIEVALQELLKAEGFWKPPADVD